MADPVSGPPTRSAPLNGVPPSRPPRRPFRDNPRLILVWIAVLLAALIALIVLAERSAQFSPDFLSEVVLYALTVADLTILVALGFVLARNVIKLMVERRRGLPFAHFRSKLVLALLGFTIVPALLVLLVGSELIRNSASRWFSTPVDEVLTSAREIASEYYRQRETDLGREAEHLAGELARIDLASADLETVRTIATPVVTGQHAGMVEIYRADPAGSRGSVVSVLDLAAPQMPRTFSRAVADRLASQVISGTGERAVLEPLGDGGQLVRVAATIRPASDRPPTGVVVLSTHLEGELARNARRIVEAYEGYQQVRVLRRPLEGVYLSFFLMMTLLILVSATWLGLYLAKRITRPVQRLAAAAKEIGAGHLDHRIEPETRDEFGSLVEAFNAMASELAVSRRGLERSQLDLKEKNLEIEARRRYIEAILDRIATGVVSIDAEGRVATVNGAASRLLRLGREAIGQPAASVFGRDDLVPLARLVDRAGRDGHREVGGQEVALVLEDREVFLAVAITPLPTETGGQGLAVVLDDVTPLIRAQKVAAWRDVARRLAHEVKNPLTPIQLSAERLRRHFAAAPEPTRRLVDECSSTIIEEVDSLKQLVDEFSQFARMPAPRTVPSDVNQLVRDALGLYRGLFQELRIEPRLAPSLPVVQLDQEQFRRVIINLVDNAIEAVTGAPGGPPPGGGLVTVDTQHDVTNGVVRVIIADNGPGISDVDRGRLFLPYYSTKHRGSGLGLAIVRRIIVEHGGSIEAVPNEPHGTRMAIELPC
jgi:two-component system nitrogen regulation sensor histidine kinase NtrY